MHTVISTIKISPISNLHVHVVTGIVHATSGSVHKRVKAETTINGTVESGQHTQGSSPVVVPVAERLPVTEHDVGGHL